MIRQPISPQWRIGLGIGSVLLLIVAYTILSQSRQNAARRAQRANAQAELEKLADREQAIEKRRADASALEDEAQRQRALDGVNRDTDRLRKQRDELTRIVEQPDKNDLTVPTWGLLIKDGLVRASTPQGAFERKEIWIVSDFKATALRLAIALLLGILLSVVVGLLMGCVDPVEAFLLPPFALLSKVPATAVLPIFFVLFQINFKMYLAIIAFGMLPTLAQAISASVRKDVPAELIFKAYTLGASQIELIWEVIYKQVLPRILDAARLQIGPALVLLVAAEWMVAGEGIGYRLRLFYQRTDMTVVFVYVLILGLLGLGVDYALIWTRRKFCPWFGD
jgi:NitT/TauT family transport system permease protein